MAPLRPLASPPLRDDPRRLTLIAAFTALAIAGRIAFLWAPNIALTYYVVFFAGVVLCTRAGALVGLLAMTVTNLMLSGLHPVLFANAPAMALLGVAGGLLRPLFVRPAKDRTGKALRVTVLACVGLWGTLLFSLTTDLLGYALQYGATPEGRAIGTAALVPYLVAGLLFNLVPAVVNALLFATLTPSLLDVLRRAGHLGPVPATDTRTVLVESSPGRHTRLVDHQPYEEPPVSPARGPAAP
ncbi:MAG: ECF transporter S component [Euryarchaeota archaeon]|nr:ECF transporter S component [Euryarchaeota archaeon]